MARKGEVWTVYKTESRNAPGWKERILLPSEELTDLLSEEWDCLKSCLK